MLPYKLRIWGIITLSIGAMALLANEYYGWRPALLNGHADFVSDYQPLPNFIDELALSLLIMGLLVVAFTRELIEDEFIQHLRLRSLMFSMVTYYLILVACVWIFYDLQFLQIALYNLFTPIIFYIIFFRVNLMTKMKAIAE